MLRCINFLEQPDAGVITLDGISIEMQPGRAGTRAPHQAQLQNLRTRLAMVFQHFNLWSHMTVLENITMAPRRVLNVSAAEAVRGCTSTRSACPAAWRTNTRRSCPVASSSAWPLRGRWRWNWRLSCSMNPPRPWTRSL